VFEKNNLGLAAPVPVPGQPFDSSLIPTLNLN
jgi:lipoic acid synthetase